MFAARIGPFHPVPSVRRDHQMIAGVHHVLPGLSFEPQARAAAEHDHPLVTVLVVPFAGGCRVPSRDDPLEPHGPSVDEHIDALGGEPALDIGE
jgi:hypothetical protein